jgi:hypothetical protein
MTEQPGLAETIAEIRAELRRAQQLGTEGDARFAVDHVDIELTVDVSRKAGGGASVTVLGFLSANNTQDRERAETSRVKISLVPVAVNGQPYEVAAAMPQRPDTAVSGASNG